MVEGALEVGKEDLPFLFGDVEMGVGVVHVLTCIFLGTAGGPADHFGDQVFEAGPGHAMVGFIHLRIGVELRVVHDAIDEVVHHGSDGIDAAQAFALQKIFGPGFGSWCLFDAGWQGWVVESAFGGAVDFRCWRGFCECGEGNSL